MIVPALLLGGAVVAAARGRRLPVGPIGRGALVGFAILLAVLCGYALSANRAIDDASAASETNPCAAIADAERATDRMPWSARAWLALAGTRINAGDPEGARLAYARALEQAPTDFRLWVVVGRRAGPRGGGHGVREGARAEPAPRSPTRRSRRSTPSSSREWTADGAPGPAREPGGGRAARVRVRRLPARRRRRGRGRHVGHDRAGAAVPQRRTTPARAIRRRGWSASRGAPSTSTTGARRWPRRSRPCPSGPATGSRTAPSSASRWRRRRPARPAGARAGGAALRRRPDRAPDRRAARPAHEHRRGGAAPRARPPAGNGRAGGSGTRCKETGAAGGRRDMNDFESDFELELHESRPAPRGELLDSLVSKVGTRPAPVRRSKWQLRLAAVMACCRAARPRRARRRVGRVQRGLQVGPERRHGAERGQARRNAGAEGRQARPRVPERLADGPLLQVQEGRQDRADQAPRRVRDAWSARRAARLV